MPPSGLQLAPAGQTYQLPANSRIEEISFQRWDKRQITEHMRSMGIALGLQGDAIYCASRDAVKDQMLGRGYQMDLHQFPNAEFLQIVAGFRQLSPACDQLTTAMNSPLHLQRTTYLVYRRWTRQWSNWLRTVGRC